MKLLSQITGLILCLVFFTTGCSSFFKRNPAISDAEKHKHYVMTLHGVRGNAESYGDFHELVKSHLNQVDPAYDVVPLNITYSIGKLNFTEEAATEEINKQLVEKIGDMGPLDKLSIVAYSMGGQVGMAWYYNTIKSSNPVYQKFARQAVKFISLDAAYWGAVEAGLATSDINVLKKTLKLVVAEMAAAIRSAATEYGGSYTGSAVKAFQENVSDKLVYAAIDRLSTVKQIQDFYDHHQFMIANNQTLAQIAKISFAEIQALSAGSLVPSFLRLNHITSPNPNMKWVSVATLIQCIEKDVNVGQAGCTLTNPILQKINEAFGKYTFGFTRRETDNAVITPSANAQFLYASDSNKNYADGELTPASAFRYSIPENNHKIYLAEALHATVIAKSQAEQAAKILGKFGESMKSFVGDVVLVYKEDCADVKKCSHPVYKYVIDELADCSRPNSTCDQDGYEDVVGALLKNKVDDTAAQESLKSELHGFVLELNLRVPKGYNLAAINSTNIFSNLRFNYAPGRAATHTLASAPGAPYFMEIARPLEVGSALVKKVTEYADQDQLKIHLTGIMAAQPGQRYDYAALEKGMEIPFEINLPNLKSRKVNAVVRPYHSTFIDLTMGRK